MIVGLAVVLSLSAEPQAWTLDGKPLYAPTFKGLQLEALDAQLSIAQDNLRTDACGSEHHDPNKEIWLGRRIAYKWLYRDALKTYTAAIADAPNHAMLRRHRGHRYITTRNFSKAAADLTLASKLIEGKPDGWEPDGEPNKYNLPLSSEHFNVHYHQGLSHYLQADYHSALAAYSSLEKLAPPYNNDESIAATAHWKYMALRRSGVPAAAAANQSLGGIHAGMRALDGGAYLQLALAYKGLQPIPNLTNSSSALDLATLGYGVGNYHYYNGRKEQGIGIWRAIVNSSYWAAFGFIAAEAELHRLESSGELQQGTAPTATLAAAAAATTTAPPSNPCTDANCTPIFYPGLNGSKCYRIPSIIRSHLNTLLAFAENRLHGCSDGGTHNLVLRRSLDAGTTWGPLITVFEGVKPCPLCPKSVSNPNPVEVKMPSGKYAVLLIFDTMNNPSAKQHGLDMAIWSDDDGKTWDQSTTTLSYPPVSNVGALVGPSIGLQQPESGTLFFWLTSGYLLYSNDQGTTWTPSEQANMHGECSIAFVESSLGMIYMNCRDGKDHKRGQLYWSKASNGSYVASQPTYPDELTDPGCQGSVIGTTITTGPGIHWPVLYTSNAASTSARERMTIHTSMDGGRSWDKGGRVVHKGPSAYSQLVSLGPRSLLGVLFEAGEKNCYETISFAVVSV